LQERRAVLTVKGLHKRFGPVDVLRGVDMDLHGGEVLAVVGDNGAGKSTLIKHLSGVYQPDSGEITLDGQPVVLDNPRQGRALGIETVYQDLSLAGDLGVGANIFLGREPVRRFLGLFPVVDNAKIKTETDELLGRIESHIPVGDLDVSSF
jgi:simple sugar transport system ATP-binding protein